MSRLAESSSYVPGSLRLDDDQDDSSAWQPVVRCCGYLPRNRSWNFAQVFSPFWRLYHNFSPGHHITHDGRTLPLAPDRFLLVPENVLFHCHSPGGRPGHLYIHFNLPPGRAPRITAPVVIRADTVGTTLAKQLSRAVARSLHRPAGHLTSALLHWVFNHLPADRPVSRLSPVPLRKAMLFVETRLGHDLSNAALARAAGVSTRGMLRLFQREFHVSPQAYVRATRLREAARRLAQGRDSIDRIAEDLGFPDRFYFTRCFTRYFQYPPAEFRHRIISGKDVRSSK